jgi:hypothetical protein
MVSVLVALGTGIPVDGGIGTGQETPLSTISLQWLRCQRDVALRLIAETRRTTSGGRCPAFRSGVIIGLKVTLSVTVKQGTAFLVSSLLPEGDVCLSSLAFVRDCGSGCEEGKVFCSIINNFLSIMW